MRVKGNNKWKKMFPSRLCQNVMEIRLAGDRQPSHDQDQA